MKRKIIFIFSIINILTYSNDVKGNTIYTQSDSILFNRYIEDFIDKGELSYNQLMVETAKYFINTPYVSSTLDTNKEGENLVVNLREFDCTTFVENCLALTECIKSNNYDFNNFCKILASIRYRNHNGEDQDIVLNYTDRLHYMSDWIYENENKKRLKDISINIGGNKISKRIDFITNHYVLYKQLNCSSNNILIMRGIEDDITSRGVNMIEKSKINISENHINDGDIIIFATNSKGLDYSHVGIAYRKSDGTLSFVHASSSKKKVILENKRLSNYCQSSNKCIGISVLRLENNR